MQVDNSEFIGIVLKDSAPIILIPEIRKGALLYTREHQIHKINQKFVVVSRIGEDESISPSLWDFFGAFDSLQEAVIQATAPMRMEVERL